MTARRLSYSLGFTLTPDIVARIERIPQQAWTPAYDADGVPRDGAWLVDATGVLDLTGWPAGMRVIVRAERPHPGAQLRFTDPTGTGSPRSSPTPAAGSSPTSNCGTAAAPAARTGSAARRTPA